MRCRLRLQDMGDHIAVTADVPGMSAQDLKVRHSQRSTHPGALCDARPPSLPICSAAQPASRLLPFCLQTPLSVPLGARPPRPQYPSLWPRPAHP